MHKISNSVMRLALYAAAVIAAAGCMGPGDIESSSSTGTQSSVAVASSSILASSSAGASSSAVSVDLLTKGKAEWEAQCVLCHSGNVKGAGTLDSSLLVEPFGTVAVLSEYITAAMPQQKPTACVGECADAIAAYIAGNNSYFGVVASTGELDKPDSPIDAAPIPFGRLSSFEYANSLRDLFGSTKGFQGDLAREDLLKFGFDNIRFNLPSGQVFMEGLADTAEAVATEAINNALSGAITITQAETLVPAGSDELFVEGNFASLNKGNTTLVGSVNAPADGSYILTVRAAQKRIGNPEAANMRILLDGTQVGQSAVSNPETGPKDFTYNVTLKRGSHAISIVFLNDVWINDGATSSDLWIDWFGLRGMGNGRDMSILACDPAGGATCAKQTIETFGKKVWRRPLVTAEVDALVALYNKAGDFQTGMKQVFKAMILSPNFMFRSELDPNPTSNQARVLNAYELAARMSYFIWASTPDDQLLTAASNGSLLNDSTIKTEVARMLADPRADTLVTKFARSWLSLDKLKSITPDATLYPLSSYTQAAMMEETLLFVRNWFSNNLPVNELLTADYTFLNQPLAEFYGETGETGYAFKRHTWQDDERRGILAQASIMSFTSHNARTSVVRRGLYVLETLLCQEPPPPPASVDASVAQAERPLGLTNRELAEMHRSNPSCASCHAWMDNIGFGLENFDVIGRWRIEDNGAMIDSASNLPSGDNFSGAADLGEVLSGYARLPVCVASHMMTYALGRGVYAWDHGVPTSDYATQYDIFEKTKATGHRAKDIVEAIVLSEAFRQRRGSESTGNN